MLRASVNATPCFRSFARAFALSHSKWSSRRALTYLVSNESRPEVKTFYPAPLNDPEPLTPARPAWGEAEPHSGGHLPLQCRESRLPRASSLAAFCEFEGRPCLLIAPFAHPRLNRSSGSPLCNETSL